MQFLVVGTCLAVFLLVVSCDDGPEVEISKGQLLQGKYMKTRLGRKFSGFLGIPYAKPPLGDLRFKEPQPADSWTGLRPAVQDTPVCPQRNPYTRSNEFEGEEDCLHINVYTPQLPSFGSDPLPVLVFFHGGGWVCGGGNSMWYGPDILLDRDVILVVMNFRLGPLGFLSTQDDVVPGNMGLKDQVLALEWIRDSIEHFGGDPNSVTVFGESAGGASVHLHMLSPLSKGLIHRGISQSGTAICPWAFAPEGEPRRNTEKLAASFGCPTEDSKEMVECLKKIDAMEIIRKDNIFWDWDFDPMIPFKPMREHRHEGAFITEHPSKLIKDGKTQNVPWITGITSAEGALRVAAIYANPHLLDEFNKDFERIAPMSLFYSETAKDAQLTTHKIREFYFAGGEIDNSTVTGGVNLYTDGWFLAAVDESIRLHLKHTKSPVYYYYFDHRGVASFSEVFGDPHTNYGVCHADDLQYLFPVSDGLFPDRPPNEADKRIAEVLTHIWVNFAKTGKPTVEDNEVVPLQWHPVTTDNLEYLHIKNDVDIEMGQNLLSERVKFWQSLPIAAGKSVETKKIQDEL